MALIDRQYLPLPYYAAWCRYDPPPYLRRKSHPAPQGPPTGRGIDGIAEEIVALHHDVANMNTDTEPHLLTVKSIGVSFETTAGFLQIGVPWMG